MNKKNIKLARQTVSYFAYLLVVWGLFRFLFKLPDLIEELWLKPVIWLSPLLAYRLMDKKRVEVFKGNNLKALVLGSTVGVLVVMIMAASNWLKNKGLVIGWDAFGQFVGISLATAITEEISFSGYIFQTLKKLIGEYRAIILSDVMFAVLHIPIGIFLYKYSPTQLLVFLVLISVAQTINFTVMSRTKNVIAPIMTHWLWSLGAYLFT